MSRRDTVIIAVLINAGLLLILFATSMPISEEDLKPSASIHLTVADEPPLRKEGIPTIPGDEVDEVLSQWSARTAQNTGMTTASSTYPVTLSYSPEHSVGYSADEPMLESISSGAPQALLAKTGAQDYAEVVIKKGDALDRIAKNYGTTVQEIMHLNQLSSSQLKIGQVLKVPKSTPKATLAEGSSKPATAEKSVNAKSASGQAQYYVVKSGDNPWLIAKKNKLELSELLQLNQLDEEKARRLKPGDTIRIR